MTIHVLAAGGLLVLATLIEFVRQARAGMDGPSVPVRVEPVRLPPPPAVPMPEREAPAAPPEPAPASEPGEVPV